MGSSSVDCRDENVESWILSKSQDYFYCGAKPGENIMPLELAIKRELAYRKRIMMLQSQTPVGSTVASMSSKIPIGSTVASMSSQIPVGSAVASMSSQIPMGSINASMSFKGTFPSRSLVGIKRKEPSCNFQCLPQLSSSCQQLQNRSVGLNKKLELNLKRRTRVTGYKSMLKGLEENQGYIGRKEGQLWCNACNVPCSGECSLAQHFMGKKHAACVSEIKNVKRRN